MTATQTASELTYQDRSDALRRTKSTHTSQKVEQRGYCDVDDDGRISDDEEVIWYIASLRRK